MSRLCLQDWWNGHLSFSIGAFIRDALLTVIQKVSRVDCDVRVLTLHWPVEKTLMMNHLSLVFHSVCVYKIGVYRVFIFLNRSQREGWIFDTITRDSTIRYVFLPNYPTSSFLSVDVCIARNWCSTVSILDQMEFEFLFQNRSQRRFHPLEMLSLVTS